MKKFFAILLAMLMVFSMVACSNNQTLDNTEPPVTGPIPGQTDEETPAVSYDASIKLVFTNEAVTFTLDKFLLDNATGNAYKHKVDSAEPDEKVELTKVTLTIFDKNDAEKNALEFMKFTTNANLLASDNITATIAVNLAEATSVEEAFTFEMLKNIEALGLKEMGVIVTGEYKRINGDATIGDEFSIETTLVVENKIDMTKLPAATVVLTETGATVKISKENLLAAMGKDTFAALNIQEVALFVSEDDRFNYEELKNGFAVEDAATNVEVSAKYDDVVEANKELKYGLQDNGHIYVMVTVSEGSNEAYTVFFVVTDLTSDYEIPDREYIYDEANPNAPRPDMPGNTTPGTGDEPADEDITDTEEPSDDDVTTPEDTNGGNE